MTLFRLGAVLKYPLVQFFAAGAVIFALDALLRSDDTPAADIIVISAAEQATLAALFEKTWQRPPTPVEREGLIEERLREELFYREALALGLDKGDVIVRRRMSQKFDFIIEDLVSRRDPTDEELTALLEENAEAYALEPVVSFRQIYLSTERRGPDLMGDARLILAELERGGDPAAFGDAIALPPAMQEVPVSGVARVFGDEFANAVEQAETGIWSGPMPSAYGAHIIFVDMRREGRASTIEEARDDLIRDWRAQQRREARDAYIEALRDKYVIEIE